MVKKRRTVYRDRLSKLAGGQGHAPDAFAGFFREVCSEVDSLDSVSLEQLNKLLVAAGFNRVSRGFFDYFQSMGRTFDERLEAWRRGVMLRVGNFRYAFRALTHLGADEIRDALEKPPPSLTATSHGPLLLKPIAQEDAPLMGYVTDIDGLDPGYTERAVAAKAKGVHNLHQYCLAEEMDVYVATSMREAEDFYAVRRFLSNLFEQPPADDVLSRIVYFDPTLSWHSDRIVKGLVECLMLRRAWCTIYMAQESETFGKDSELATTLVQGKTAIVYVPEVTDVGEAERQMRLDLKMAGANDAVPPKDGRPVEFARLEKRFARHFPVDWAGSPWRDGIQTEPEFAAALGEYLKKLSADYNRRARFLRHGHPLGVQVGLHSGVSNGVLVVRSVDECREVLQRVLEGRLEFSIRARDERGELTVPDLDAPTEADRFLIEKITNCVYRVAVGESLVSNAFWNWYPDRGQPTWGLPVSPSR